MMRASLSPLVLALLAAPAAAAPPPPPKLAPEQARTIAALLDADPTVAAAAKMCPAEAFGRIKGRSGSRFDEAIYCAHAPVACAQNCLAHDSAAYCIGLALYFSANEDVVAPLQTLRLFALACAEGEPSGCTNRASIIRDTQTSGDPFLEVGPQAKASCEHRGFALACAKEDSWGCAMLGQSLAAGEGTTPDPAAARRAWTRACTISEKSGQPEFPACLFAKRGMEQLGR